MEKRPDPEPGSRFKLAAIVFNLTGRGHTSRDDRLPRSKLQTCLLVDECNLADLKAPTILSQIRAGKAPRCLLGWVPLMQKGADLATLKRWRRLASAEPDPRRRADYGGLALVFAELAGCLDVWRSFLEDWNLVESQIVQEWLAAGVAKARLETLRDTLRVLLEDRFGALPDSLRQRIEASSDLDRLRAAVRQVPRLGSLDELTI